MNLFKSYLHNRIKNLASTYDLRSPMLDVGCGRGDLIELFTGHDIEGIDFSDSAIKICRRKGLKVRKLDFLNNKKKYNSIICVDVVEHMKDDKKFIKALHNSLNKNGKLILLAPSGRMMRDDLGYGHYRRYSKKDIVEKMLSVGFKVDHAEMFGYPLFHYGRFLMNVFVKEFHDNKEENTKASSCSPAFSTKAVGLVDRLDRIKVFQKLVLVQNLFSRGNRGLAVLLVASKS